MLYRLGHISSCLSNVIETNFQIRVGLYYRHIVKLPQNLAVDT